jgi:hypothetical protein
MLQKTRQWTRLITGLRSANGWLSAPPKPRSRRDFEDMETRWVGLPRSYEFAARLNNFVDCQKSKSTASVWRPLLSLHARPLA